MKRFICIFMLIIIFFSCSSCMGVKKEIEKLAVVLATGYDLTAENKYLLTAQVLNTQSDSTEGSNTQKWKKQNSPEVMYFSSEGNSPQDAINNLATNFGRNLYFGHSQYIVIGKTLAKSGLSLLVDSSLRAHEARPTNIMILTKDTAYNIITAGAIDEKMPSNSVANLIKLQKSTGFAPVVSRLDFANALLSKTQAPIMGVIDLDKNNAVGNTFIYSGTAVFEKDKLIGYLDKVETRGMQWIKGKVKSGTITAPSMQGSEITFALLKASSEIKPIIEGNTITMQVTIKQDSNVIEMSDHLDIMKNPEIMDELGRIASKAIKSEAELALNAAQNNLNADIFDFGSYIHRADPEAWAKLEGKWKDIFPYIKVEINVISKVRGTGVISKPVQ